MGDTSASRCTAQTRFRPARYASNHTVRCELEAGHDDMHLWRKDGRSVFWDGPAKPVEDNTRLRFGTWLEDK